jgi:hypothetical protein
MVPHGVGREERTFVTDSQVETDGPPADHVSGYRTALAELRYSERATRTHLELLTHLGGWLNDGSVGLGDLTDDPLVKFLADRRRGGDRAWSRPLGWRRCSDTSVRWV